MYDSRGAPVAKFVRIALTAEQVCDPGLDIARLGIAVKPRAFSGKVESEGTPKEARIRFKIPTGTRGPVMNGEAIFRRPA